MKEENAKMKISVFTPTYNRKDTLHRVYESLCKQTVQNFEWLVIDDGSNDGTWKRIEDFREKAAFPVRYIRQENRGKFRSLISGVREARGEFFLIADSDDAFEPETIETYLEYWNSIEPAERENYSGISCLCKYSGGGGIVGDEYPQSPMVSNAIEILYKYKVTGEKWGILRTDVIKEFIPRDIPDDVRFISETYLWYQIARKYKTLYINIPLREYYKDSAQSLSNVSYMTERQPMGIFLTEEMIFTVTAGYYRYNLKETLLHLVKLDYAAIRAGITVGRVLSRERIEKSLFQKLLVTMAWPAGKMLSVIRKIQYGGGA